MFKAHHHSSQILRMTGFLIVSSLMGSSVYADRTISASDYLDKLRGMWFGQLIGNHSGRDFEGHYCTREAAPDEEFTWVIKTSYEDPWTGDDDTNFEYLYLHCLEAWGISPTFAQIQSEWDDHVILSGIYIANRQAKYLMQHGFLAPDTGSFRHNFHAYAIDSQITTESLGALTPGNRQWAIDSTRTFGGVTNEGYSLHAAQFYAAMYAAAAFENDIEAIVQSGQSTIPQSSRSWQAIQNVRDWHSMYPTDWREARRLIYDHYHGTYDYGRYRYWIESTINLANTVLALLYGQGDFEETVQIAVLAGYDADCNPATAGGLIGLIQGFDALPTDLTGTATDHYKIDFRPGLPPYDTITGVSSRLQAITEQVIVATGGTVAGGTYTVSDADPIVPDPEMPDPTAPAHLVADLLNAGQTVTCSASIENHNPMHDRLNLESIINGITDLRYNGHVPYYTNDGDNPQPAGGDFYQLGFSRFCRIDSLTFYEGDLGWDAINDDPRVTEPRGGYFLDLSVDILTGQGWAVASNVQLSEPLDAYAAYQVIELTFAPVVAEAVRIHGNAGGTREYTSIVELACHGAMTGDFDTDGDVDVFDLPVFVDVLIGVEPDSTHMLTADTNGDGQPDGRDIPLFVNSIISDS